MKQLLPVLALALALPTQASESTETVHRSTEGFSASVGKRGAATTSVLKEQRTLASEILSKPRSIGVDLTSANAWIFDADAVLYDDLDDDGYFRFVSVRFDADSYFDSMYVYAMLYLSADGETWEHYYTTDDFLIGGTHPDDEYFVETELLQGYEPGLYDVLIELYDADFGTFEDEFGPAETSALSLLPIEDASFDAAPLQIAVSNEGGGGSTALWILPLITAVGLARRRRLLAKPDLTRNPGNEQRAGNGP